MDPQPSERKYDVIVVGGGVAARLVATPLARAGKSVLILEAGTDEAANPGSYNRFLFNFYRMGATRSAPMVPTLETSRRHLAERFEQRFLFHPDRPGEIPERLPAHASGDQRCTGRVRL